MAQMHSKNGRPPTIQRCIPCALVILGISLLASGCNLPQWARNGFKVGSDYCKPVAEVSDNWIDSDDPRVISQPPEYPDWWAVFQDPVLNDLIETAYGQNLTLREAGLRVLEARYQRAIAVGSLFPQSQQLSGSYTRQQISIVQQPFILPIPGFFQRAFDAGALAGSLTWELDVWGRFRRSVEAADASLDASIEEYDAILVCLIAEVVTAYVDIRTFEQRLDYARGNVRIQENSLVLTRTRADQGRTGYVSVHLSESNLDGTKAAIPSLEISLRQANNRLCTLLGRPTVDLSESLGKGDGIPAAPAEVAIGIPADLLRRRPDVRAAERQVAAQSARIGVAISDLYPSIAVSGTISVQAEKLGHLFTSLAQGGSVGPSFQWNILNYGRIQNNVRFQDARFYELIASYQNAVLAANQEVEDALVAFLRNRERVQSLADSTKATELALELETLNFKEGETDFTGVFVLQGDLTRKQDQLAEAQGEVVTNLISVYKALGGGWEIRLPNSRPRRITEVEPNVAPEELAEPPFPMEETLPALMTDDEN